MRSRMAPSNGAVSTESASCCWAMSSSDAALREQGLAGAGRLDRVLVAPLGHAERGVGGVEVRAGMSCSSNSLTMRSRVSWACLRVAAACLTPAVCPGSTASLVPPGGRPSWVARLLEGGFGLADPELEVGRRQPRDHLAAAHGRADVHLHPLEPAGDLEAELGLLVGGQRAGDLDRPRQRSLLGRGEAHLARGTGGLAAAVLALLLRPLPPAAAGSPPHPVSNADRTRVGTKRLKSFLKMILPWSPLRRAER